MKARQNLKKRYRSTDESRLVERKTIATMQNEPDMLVPLSVVEHRTVDECRGRSLGFGRDRARAQRR